MLVFLLNSTNVHYYLHILKLLNFYFPKVLGVNFKTRNMFLFKILFKQNYQYFCKFVVITLILSLFQQMAARSLLSFLAFIPLICPQNFFIFVFLWISTRILQKIGFILKIKISFSKVFEEIYVQTYQKIFFKQNYYIFYKFVVSFFSIFYLQQFNKQLMTKILQGQDLINNFSSIFWYQYVGVVLSQSKDFIVTIEGFYLRIQIFICILAKLNYQFRYNNILKQYYNSVVQV
eukprot:TRINITY_DN5530_c0_g1_i11.p1 TRINITY_DN5530_c0_g1~~TRINITY_DN5530_c0_g1_i11.p1  ORF type:complete len:242 (+),score=-18.05 TRINITY_DN5530_c0_g1_i11:28-726(+)